MVCRGMVIKEDEKIKKERLKGYEKKRTKDNRMLKRQ
jgi:hypothetical protein